MKNKYIFHILLFLSQMNLFGQDFQWVRPFEGSYFSGDNASAIVVDDNENNYTFGIIYEPLFDIDPTASGTQIIDNTAQSINPCSLFLTKLDVNGNFVWGKTFGHIFGTSDRVVDMEIGTDGNLYLLADIYEQTTFMQKFITVFKIDPQGNILMTKKITNLDNPTQYDIYSSSSLALDSQNNIFISGSYKYQLKIDPVNPQLNFNTGGDSFLLKINNTGTIVYGKRFGVLFTNTHYESVKIDNTQNPILVISNGDNQSYPNYGYNVFKVSTTDGAIMWQKFLDNQFPETFNIDSSGNIIIAAHGNNSYGSDIDVDPGTAIVNIRPTPYLLWLTNKGDFLDVKKYPPLNGFPYFIFSKIEFDTSNNTYIVGGFINSFDADPSNNSFILSYTCYDGIASDAFCIKFDNSRNFDSAFKLGDYNGNCLNFYFTDFKIKNDNQYYVGNFVSTADFDPTPNSFTLNTNDQFGSRFTLKLGSCTTAMPSGNTTQNFCSSQNPSVGDLLPNSSSIKWYTSTTSTNQLSAVTSLVNGNTYYASRQNGNCPESIQRLGVTVTITQSPSPPNTTNQTFCESEHAIISNLTATGQNLKWYASTTDTTILPINTVLQNNTTYYASQTVSSCESNRASINVTVNSVPLPIFVSPQTFCIQQNASLNSIAITGQNIKWYNAATGGNLLSNTTVLANGVTYYATQTLNNCESIRVAIVIIIQNTTAPVGSANQTFCSIQNPTLDDIVVTGSNLNWYASSSSTNTIPNTTLLVNGVTYYATQTSNTCESTSRLPLTVNLIKTLYANDYSETICDNLNDSSEIISLLNFNSNLVSNAANFTFQYYASSLGATNQTNTELITNTSNYNLIAGLNNVYVRITSVDGCYQIVKLNLTLVDKPITSIKDIVSVCERNNITINAGSGFDSYTWSTGATSQSIKISQAGNYSVIITKNYGNVVCSTTKNFSVVLSNAATITNIEIQDWSDTDNIIKVNTAGLGDYEYSIDGIIYQTSNVFYGLNSGRYTVYVRDKNGCGISEEEVYLLMYPKYFTPNNDGYNDTWAIKLSYYEPGLKTAIFDRYGKILATLNNTSSWDGKYNGYQLPSDDYWFVVTRENGKEYKGHFTLKR